MERNILPPIEILKILIPECSDPPFHYEFTVNVFNVIFRVHRRIRLCKSGGVAQCDKGYYDIWIFDYSLIHAKFGWFSFPFFYRLFLMKSSKTVSRYSSISKNGSGTALADYSPPIAGTAPLSFPFHSSSAEVVKGFLYKWTNYMKGYQRRWFIISGGNLYYYKSPTEVELTCRGSMSLVNCQIESCEDSSGFQIIAAQTWHLKASTEIDKQRWMLALKLAREWAIADAKASNYLADEEEVFAASFHESEIVSEKNMLVTSGAELKSEIMVFNQKLDDISTLKNLISKHHSEFVKDLSVLSKMVGQEIGRKAAKGENDTDIASQLKVVQERATLLKVTSGTMLSTCSDFVEVSEEQKKKWERSMRLEKQQIARLQKTIEDLLKSQAQIDSYLLNNLSNSGKTQESYDLQEKLPREEVATACLKPTVVSSVKLGCEERQSSNFNSDSETDEFFDCVKDDRKEDQKLSSLIIGADSIGLGPPTATDNDSLENDNSVIVSSASDPPMSVISDGGPDQNLHRTSIPPRPEMSLNLWKILKNCIGKDLSRIPMPVNFNEPLSFLQRLAEDLEYSSLLDTACSSSSIAEQIAYVGAFGISVFSTTVYRHSKPFNPLLHETFELDLSTEKQGFRLISEQVKHHPPISVQHVEGRGWSMRHQYSMNSSFRGKFLQITPTGVQQVTFDDGNHYIFSKPQTIVNNIIVGSLSIYQQGDMLVTNIKTNDRMLIKFHVPSFGAATYKITADILSSEGNLLGKIFGFYNERIEFTDLSGKTSKTRVIWTANPVINPERYFMSEFAMMLNEEDERAAPTDSRRRQDVRLLEHTKWEFANEVKAKLEEKQRARRRQQIENKPTDYVYTEPPPVWFKEQFCDKSQRQVFAYQGGYWASKEKQQWQMCPDIYN